MLFISIITILTASALPSIHISPRKLTRCGSLALISTGVMAANTLNVSAMEPGIILYNGILQVTPTSQIIDILACLVASIFAGLVWPVYHIYRQNKYISTSWVKKYQPTVSQCYITLMLTTISVIILVSNTSLVIVFLGIVVQYYAVNVLVSRYPGTGYNFIKLRNTYIFAIVNYAYLYQVTSKFADINEYQYIHIIFLVCVVYVLYNQFLDTFFDMTDPLAIARYVDISINNSIYLKVPRWVYTICFYIIVNIIINAPIFCINESFIEDIIDVATQTDITDLNTQRHDSNPGNHGTEIPIPQGGTVTPTSGNVTVDVYQPEVRPATTVVPGTVNPIISFFKTVLDTVISCFSCGTDVNSDSGSIYEMQSQQEPPLSARTDTTFPSDLSQDSPSMIDIANEQANRVFQAKRLGVSEEAEAEIYEQHMAQRNARLGISPTDQPSGIDHVRRLRSYAERPR